MYKVVGISFVLVLVVGGVFLVYAAISGRIGSISSPPPEMWTYYSQSFLLKFLGPRFLRIFTLVLGVMFIIAGIVGLVNGWKDLVR